MTCVYAMSHKDGNINSTPEYIRRAPVGVLTTILKLGDVGVILEMGPIITLMTTCNHVLLFRWTIVLPAIDTIHWLLSTRLLTFLRARNTVNALTLMSSTEITWEEVEPA